MANRLLSAETVTTSCATPLDSARIELVLVLMSSVGVACVLLCLIAVAMVLILRLYKSIVYRLASYQVCTALLYGVVCGLEIMSFKLVKQTSSYGWFCQATAFLMNFLPWVKLMFTAWISVHLFFFVVFYVNLKRCEVLYVISALVVPLVITTVPFATRSYGPAGAWCSIQQWKENCPLNISKEGVIEVFVLWYGPASAVLVLNSIAVVVILIVLVKRACKKSQGEKWQQHKEALNQSLPLLAYPITYTLLLVVPLTNRAYGAQSHSGTVDYTLLTLTGTLIPLWGLSAGVAHLVHILVMKRCSRKKDTCRNGYGALVSSQVTMHQTESCTFFEPERENEIGDPSNAKTLITDVEDK